MAFNRPPRIQPDLPVEPVEIPGPQDVPSKPASLNILGIGLPLGAVLLTVVLLSSGGGGGASYIRFLPIMLATYLATGVTYVVGRRSYKRQIAQVKATYRRTLLDQEHRLQELIVHTRRVLQELYPNPDECLDRALRKDPRLGERRPHDGDFLTVRIGIGAIPVPFPLSEADRSRSEPDLAEEIALASGLLRDYASVPESPMHAGLAAVGSLGIAGPTNEIEAASRAIVSSLVTTHWPEEVRVAVLATPDRAKSWTWLTELPHFAPTFGGGLAQPSKAGDTGMLDELEAELRQREEVLAAQATMPGRTTDPAGLLASLVILFDGLDPDFSHPGLSLLLSQGMALGAHGIFLTQRPERVPGQCGAVLQISRERFLYQETGEAGRKLQGVPDRMQLEHAARLASALAAIDWPESSDASRPPDLITLLDLFGAENIERLPIESWWDGNPPYGYLRAPIGRTSATSDLVFDLNDQEGAHGPHGLIGGMTGSGKSEILKTALLALAATHSPYDLNFALIDYKGGAAFNELSQLPHTVGVVTDIETHATYAERVILALTGEIEHRKRVLERARLAFGFGRSHIDEYRQLTVKRPLPRLVIVFDEFAEFKSRHPEESKRLIGIARQGRSLGVHLILATQNIEAAVDPEILQNSTFRICLRVSQAQDSIQMIGIPDAVNLPRGRAFFRANSRHQFQGAYCGGFYGNGAEAQPPNGVVRIGPDGARQRIELPGLGDGRSRSDEVETVQPTEAQAIVDRILQASRMLRIKRPPPVWPDPLPERLYLPEILGKHFQGGWDGSRWDEFRPLRSPSERPSASSPVIGMFDDPAHQRQLLLRLDPDRGGHNLLVFGSAGAGKSTLLRTLVSAAAHAQSPLHAHFYILDFGGSSALKLLEGIPHLGAVVTRFEEERVVRLIRYLQLEISRRSELLRAEGVDHYRDFNARKGESGSLPTLFFLIDGFGEFKRVAPPEQVKAVSGLVAGGAAVGVRVIIAANLQSDVPNDIFANIGLRLTFQQADQTEYYRIVGRPSEAKLRQDLENPPPPGRGMMRGNPPLEFQAALPAWGESEDEQARNLSRLANAMREAWDGARPPIVRALPVLVSLEEVQAASPEVEEAGYRARLGLDFDTLSPVALDLSGDGPGFLVAGTSPQSGKTTALRSWILGLAAQIPSESLQFVFLDFHTRTLSAFRGLPHRHVYLGSAAGLEDSLAALREEVERRRSQLDEAFAASAEDFDSRALLSSWPHILVVIDDYDRFAERADQAPKQLAELLTEGGELGLSFVVAGNASELPKDFDDPFIRSIRRLGCGVLLSGTEGIEQFNNARRPAGQPASGLPPGRSYLIKRGTVRLFQVAAYWSGVEAPDQALAAAVESLARPAS